MSINCEDELMHEGKAHDENPPGRGSGRYGWGTGEHAFQREAFSVQMIKDLYKAGQNDEDIVKTFRELGYDDVEIYQRFHKYGKKDKDIAKALGYSTTTLKAKKSIYSNQVKMANMAKAIELDEKGLSNTKIAKELGVTEGTVRNYLKPERQRKDNVLFRCSDSLKDMVDKKRYLDIGPGGENFFGVKWDTFKTAAAVLEEQGYHIYPMYYDRMGGQNQLTVNVLCAPDVTYKDCYAHKGEVQSVMDYVNQNGLPSNVLGLRPPVSVDSDRIMVRYAEDGGADRDGMIQLKRGVEDLGLGSQLYAQVRIAVDGTHYLKGMAVYADPKEFPKGKDIIFNTNKKDGTPWMQDDPDAKQVFKHMTDDPDNPFKAAIKVKDGKVVGQFDYEGKDGKMHQSPINIVNEEGDWSKWKKSLPTQILAKEPLPLIKQQLKIDKEAKLDEFNDIKSLTNPTVKKMLLEEFAASCDTASVEMRGAPFAGQQSYSILSIPSLKPNTIYAPKFEHGSKVVSIRFPNQGLFEIVESTVDNHNKEALSIMKNAQDAVGIPPSTAHQMSGADFDGDSVVIIPTETADGRVINKIKTQPARPELRDFDPNIYEIPEGSKVKPITAAHKNKMMGEATNLLMDMSFAGAPDGEINRAVKFCYVIIDSEKHKLDWKRAYKDFDIDGLKKKWQAKIDPETGKESYGAGTIITRAKSPKFTEVYKRKWKPDKNTGEWLYEDTPQMKNTWVRKEDGTTEVTGKTPKMQKVPLMTTVSDARELMSGPDHIGTEKERVYAAYANDMKALANEARRVMVNEDPAKRDPEAAKKYAKEVASLESKLDIAKANAPRERQAIVIYNNIVKNKRAALYEANPNISKQELNKEMKKVKRLASTYARNLVGAKKDWISFTDKEWEAVQARAISENKLTQILRNAKSEEVKQLAMPRNTVSLSQSKISLIKSYDVQGLSIREIADKLNVSPSTVSRYIRGKEE